VFCDLPERRDGNDRQAKILDKLNMREEQGELEKDRLPRLFIYLIQQP
jgi:hypothetical protein